MPKSKSQSRSGTARRQFNASPRKRASTRKSKLGEKVEKVDPTKGRCLLTRSSYLVNLCHLIPLKFEGRLLSILEGSWGCAKGIYVNLNSRYNIVALQSNWHTALDDSYWSLIPDIRILRFLCTLYEVTIDTSDTSATAATAPTTAAADTKVPCDLYDLFTKPVKLRHSRLPFKVFVKTPPDLDNAGSGDDQVAPLAGDDISNDVPQGAPVFPYRFLPHPRPPGMKWGIIAREENGKEDEDIYRPGAYEGFPELWSYIHPHIVVWQAGYHLNNNPITDPSVWEGRGFEDIEIRMVEGLFAKWTQDAVGTRSPAADSPGGDGDGDGSKDNGDSVDEDDTDGTPSTREDPSIPPQPQVDHCTPSPEDSIKPSLLGTHTPISTLPGTSISTIWHKITGAGATTGEETMPDEKTLDERAKKKLEASESRYKTLETFIESFRNELVNAERPENNLTDNVFIFYTEEPSREATQLLSWGPCWHKFLWDDPRVLHCIRRGVV